MAVHHIATVRKFLWLSCIHLRCIHLYAGIFSQSEYNSRLDFLLYTAEQWNLWHRSMDYNKAYFHFHFSFICCSTILWMDQQQWIPRQRKRMGIAMNTPKWRATSSNAPPMHSSPGSGRFSCTTSPPLQLCWLGIFGFPSSLWTRGRFFSKHWHEAVQSFNNSSKFWNTVWNIVSHLVWCTGHWKVTIYSWYLTSLKARIKAPVTQMYRFLVCSEGSLGYHSAALKRIESWLQCDCSFDRLMARCLSTHRRLHLLHCA